jgi:hypothetical protein
METDGSSATSIEFLSAHACPGFRKRMGFRTRSLRTLLLARWFNAEFGDTQCRALTGCDFSTVSGAMRYTETDAVERCRAISEKVAAEVLRMAAD